MKAVTWQGVRDVQVQEVPDPRIEEPTDAVVRITSTGLCGSDLHLYETLGPFMGQGNILGHEPMGIVEEVGAQVTRVAVGDRVVLPFQICCGSCYMCDQGLQTQCETTQVREHGMGAALYGFSRLYGEVPGGQAEYLRAPLVDANAVVVPDGPPDDRFVYLSDVLPDRVAVGGVRRHPRRGERDRDGRGPDRRHGEPHRSPPWPPRDHRRPRARAAASGWGRSAPRRSTCARSTTSVPRCAA